MRASNAARAAPPDLERDPRVVAELAALHPTYSAPSQVSHRTGAEHRTTVAEAAAEYRAGVGQKNPTTKPATPDKGVDDLVAWLRRDFVAECLDTVPRDAVAAQFALDAGDDERAFLLLQRVIIAIKEAARTFNELRKGAP